MSAWIKFRTSLLNHPKVVRIACALRVQSVYDPCTSRVPDVCMMSTTIGALVQMWSMADSHAEGNCLPNMSLGIVDNLFGVPGFAQAMVDVGWLEERDGSLYLPNYQEHNGPTAKRRAINSRSMRERRKSVYDPCTNRVQDVDKSCTKKSTKRESKNKESNPNGLLPLTPTKTSTKFDPIADIEAPFVSAYWTEAWAKWCRHRSELRKPLTRQATESQIAELAKLGEARAIAAIYHSLRNGWQGIFEPKADSPGAGYGHRPSATERAAESAERLMSGKSTIANQIFAELQAMENPQ